MRPQTRLATQRCATGIQDGCQQEAQMSSVSPVWVGIDVSSRTLDISLGSRGDVFQVENTPSGVRTLVARLRHRPVVGIICEATGSYH